MKKIMMIMLVFVTSYVHASGVVTTFVNSTDLDVKLEVHFSDNTITDKIVSMAQSYDVVNFNNKRIESVIFSSVNKDKNGNLYGQLNQKFSKSIKNSSYTIGLKDVPAYKVPAAQGTEEFEMPATQAFTCIFKK